MVSFLSIHPQILDRMGHWILSNIPWRSLLVYVAILRFKRLNNEVYIQLGHTFFIFYVLYIFTSLHHKFEAIIRNIIIPEFIDKRPFREINSTRREVILKEILANVNNSVNFRLGTNYSFTDTIDLVMKYNECMSTFVRGFENACEELPDKEIKGWDKIMLVAKNMEEEDMEYAINTAYSNDLIQKYCRRTSAPNSVLNERMDVILKSGLGHNKPS